MKLAVILISLFLVFFQGPIIAIRAYREHGITWVSFVFFALGCVGITAYAMGLY